jgi:Domain of unknown function (DUF1931)
MPAKAGIHDFLCCDEGKSWMPTCAGHDGGGATYANTFGRWYNSSRAFNTSYRKVHDLLVRGQATAKANGRDIIEPYDLPIELAGWRQLPRSSDATKSENCVAAAASGAPPSSAMFVLAASSVAFAKAWTCNTRSIVAASCFQDTGLLT